MGHDRFDAFTRRAAVRGLAAALLGGVVAGLPVDRRATSVRAGGGALPCEINANCFVAQGCCEELKCEASEEDPEMGQCVKRSNNDNDKNKKNNDDNDDNDENNQNNNNGGNNGGDGIFWPCNIPWFANNPACSGTLGSLLGR